jgi:hypothetical protein
MSIAWSEMVHRFEVEPGNEITTVCPVFSIALYVRVPHLPDMGQIYQRALEIVKDGLTHYQAETMGKPAAIGAQAFEMVPTWLRKPKKSHRYHWLANGGADLGCLPPSLELRLQPWGATTPEQLARSVSNQIAMAGEGDVGDAMSSVIRITLPTNHPLVEATPLAAWLTDLDVVKHGRVAYVECGFGLASVQGLRNDVGTKTFEQTLCSRYPGLDCFRLNHALRIYRADGAYPDLVPLVKRAAWMNVLSPLTVQFLGGEAAVRAQLADTPALAVQTLPHGLLVRAGERPQLGDLSAGDGLPLQRKLASVLRPARVNRLAEESEFWNHFFNIFDKPYA